MEKRKGILRGKFIDFIYGQCATNKQLIELAPISKMMKNRQEREELVLRFFALLDMYPKYDTKNKGIARLLDDYVVEKNKTLTEDEMTEKTKIFESMLNMVKNSFQFGFAKDEKPQVSRVYFEALSVGCALALKEKPALQPRQICASSILQDNNFYQQISGKYQTHTPSKIKARIDFIKNFFLGQ